ncbi:MAG: 3-methyl-2-oxobutanoate dehydrogenase subunit beta, partial [Peptococcaceae bacterium]|nr:3-methyl-2-oxobutanoate dehydrogenase subunit beta [Peptococcaceae bacterium]
TCLAFDLADEYRSPVIILGDGILGQMMEAVELPPMRSGLPEKSWAATGCRGRVRNVVTSFFMDAADLERHNLHLQEKYHLISMREARGQGCLTEDAEVLVVAFGSTARIAKAAVRAARADGIAAGLFRPVTLWPFPADLLNRAAARAAAVLTVEMNYGQMVEDVRLALRCRLPVHFYGRGGGMVPFAGDIHREILKLGGARRENCHRPA